MLEAVHDIPGAPPGAYWDGGITDYHLHLNYANTGRRRAVSALPEGGGAWLAGQGPAAAPQAPRPSSIARWCWRRTRNGCAALPNGKLPDRNDFVRYGNDPPARMKAWNTAAQEARRLADELAEWLLGRRRRGCRSDQA